MKSETWNILLYGPYTSFKIPAETFSGGRYYSISAFILQTGIVPQVFLKMPYSFPHNGQKARVSF